VKANYELYEVSEENEGIEGNEFYIYKLIYAPLYETRNSKFG